jgi:hypothetical protein
MSGLRFYTILYRFEQAAGLYPGSLARPAGHYEPASLV